MRSLIAASLALTIVGGSFTFGSANATLRQRLIERMMERGRDPSAVQAPAPGGEEMAYGTDPLQKLDVWRASGASGPAPLILFVHGGGWHRGDKRTATGADKVQHFTGNGYAFASMNYRLVPEARVEDQAQDVADALAFVLKNAQRLGIDPRRVVLMGHSAGAHLVALVGTDPAYLAKAGLSEKDVDGIIPLDGAAYDVPRQMVEGPRIMQDTYRQAFSADARRQRVLSPTLNAAAPNVNAFLILHVQRADGIAQSRALAEALTAAGTRATVQGFPGEGLRGHAEINRRLGEADYPATPVVDAWLKALFADDARN